MPANGLIKAEPNPEQLKIPHLSGLLSSVMSNTGFRKSVGGVSQLLYAVWSITGDSFGT